MIHTKFEENGLHIPYSEEYGKYDSPGVEAVCKLVSSCDYSPHPYPDGKYGVDVAVFDGEKRLFDIDAEVRSNWTGKRFPFKDIHVPARKFRKKRKYPTFFATISLDGSKMILCRKEDLVESENVTNVRSETPEPFYGYSRDGNEAYHFNVKDPATSKAEMFRLVLSL
jgi:hypothetical protein